MPLAAITKPKFYVYSGTLKWVGEADTAKEAAKRAVLTCGGKDKLDGHFIYVDERGFRDRNGPLIKEEGVKYGNADSATFAFSTDIILKQAGYKDDDEDEI